MTDILIPSVVHRQVVEALENSAPTRVGIGWIKKHNAAKAALSALQSQAPSAQEGMPPQEWLLTAMELARQYAHAYFNRYVDEGVRNDGNLPKFQEALRAHLSLRIAPAHSEAEELTHAEIYYAATGDSDFDHMKVGSSLKFARAAIRAFAVKNGITLKAPHAGGMSHSTEGGK
jgi:hypothetical protein